MYGSISEPRKVALLPEFTFQKGKQGNHTHTYNRDSDVFFSRKRQQNKVGERNRDCAYWDGSEIIISMVNKILLEKEIVEQRLQEGGK